jgi:hypothetical protein
MNIVNNEIYKDDIKKIICECLPNILNDMKKTSNENKVNEENKKEKLLKGDETQNPNYNILCHFNLKGRKPKGRKIQKIDPNNLNTIIKVYDSMIYALRCPDNKGCQKTGIQFAIKNNSIYKDYRWNFVNEGEDPNISKVSETKIINKPRTINTIIELNNTKTEVLNTYYTKKLILQKYKISKKILINIIKDNKLYDDKYFIEYHKCPQDLLDKYDKPINRLKSVKSKAIKQIHPITKTEVIFNTFTEISNKFGICAKTIQNAIDSKSAYYGFIWEYA